MVTATEMDAKLNGKADSSHNHAAGNITSGTLSADRLPTVPIAKGGTVGATSWTSATRGTEYFSGGYVYYTKIGYLVIVMITDLVVSKTLTHGAVIATGLPTRKGTAGHSNLTMWDNNGTPRTLRCTTNTSGGIIVHYSTNTPDDRQYYGTLFYFTS